MTWRRVVIAVLVVVVLAVGGAVAANAWLGSDDARHRLEVVLGRALHRDVTIAELDVEASEGAIELRGVVVANPEGWDGPPLLQADRLRLDADLDDALDGRLDGDVSASGLELWIGKRDGLTNLHGMIRPREPSAEPIDLNLDIDLSDAKVLLADLDRNEELQLEGVAVGALLSNRAHVKDVAVDLEIAALSMRGVGLHAIEIEAVGTDDEIELRRVAARIGERGRLDGSGAVQLDESTHWSFDVTAADVAIDADLIPVLAAFYPPLSGVDSMPEADTTGSVDAELRLGGAGTSWPVVMPVLAGSGVVTVRDVVLPEQALASVLAGLAGRKPGPWPLGTTRVEVSIADGWIALQRVVNEGAEVMPPVTGRVGLDGTLDLEVDLMPVVRAYGGGIYATVARATSSIPVRVRGTVKSPDFEPPSASSVAKGLFGGLVHRALSD